jgi:hypothetical protein
MLLIGWLVTAVGWVVTSWQANRREVRKERRAEVDACCKMTAELLERSRKFYLADATDTSQHSAADIHFLMARLIRRVERLGQQHWGLEAVSEVGSLFDSVTGNDFDSPHRQRRAADDPLFKKIEEDAHVLMDKLENAFAHIYTGWVENGWRTWRRASRQRTK